MLKKLKAKFLVATVITLMIVIGVIVGAINIFNYRSIILDADELLSVLMDNSGKFPNKPGHDPKPDFNTHFTPESPFESRYFTVTIIRGNVASVDTSSIAAVNKETAGNLAMSVATTEAEKGFRGHYRYLMEKDDDKTSIIFLDCTRSLHTAHNFLISSVFISFLGIVAVFLLMWIVSDRIVKPIIAGYEKQKRFITDAGHDIKTPITIIDADAELLEMEIGENEWLSDIKKQSARLASLTADLIYLSRMEEREHLPHIEFPISEVIDEVVSSFNAPAKTKNIKISASISPAIFYQGDEESIKKLITLLMDNAVKYSPENETVTVGMKKLSRGIVVKISNLATNLTADSVEHMFERFYRSDPARSSNGGFGIGLSVANAIVASHKGKISATKHGDLLTIEVIL